MAEQDTSQQPHGWVLVFLLVETGGTAEKVQGRPEHRDQPGSKAKPVINDF